MSTNVNHLPDADYVLTDGGAWFDVGPFTIRIHETDEGVVVDVYDAKVALTGDFDAALMSSTYAFTADTEQP